MSSIWRRRGRRTKPLNNAGSTASLARCAAQPDPAGRPPPRGDQQSARRRTIPAPGPLTSRPTRPGSSGPGRGCWCAVIALACSHNPHASDTPASPAAAGARPTRPGTRWPPRSCPAPANPRARHRGTHHKHRQIQIAGQLMQIPRRVHLGPQHRIHPLRRQRGDHRVIEHPGGMHHPASTGYCAGSCANNAATASRSATSQATTCTCAPACGQLGRQLRGALGAVPAPAGQHHMPHPIRATRCRASTPPAIPVPPVINTVPPASPAAPRAWSTPPCRYGGPG